MLKSERKLWMREFSDLKPFFDIPDSFFYLVTSVRTRTSFRRRTNPCPKRPGLLAQSALGNSYCATKTKMGQ
jgi:hypothetical protein